MDCKVIKLDLMRLHMLGGGITSSHMGSRRIPCKEQGLASHGKAMPAHHSGYLFFMGKDRVRYLISLHKKALPYLGCIEPFMVDVAVLKRYFTSGKRSALLIFR